MTEVARWALLVYSLFLIAGGIMGYVMPETPSKASLIAGTATGLAALVAFFLVSAKPLAGFSLGLLVALLTGVMMFMRLKETGKFMPSGAVVALSSVVLVILIIALLSLSRQSA